MTHYGMRRRYSNDLLHCCRSCEAVLIIAKIEKSADTQVSYFSRLHIVVRRRTDGLFRYLYENVMML
jgi:hypothetical protein